MGHYECRRCNQRFDVCSCPKVEYPNPSGKSFLERHGVSAVNIPTIKQVMRENSILTRYEDHKLWYQCTWLDEDRYPHNFEFPIDTQGSDAAGTFNRSEKNITLMRWIRKHIDFLQEANGGSARS